MIQLAFTYGLFATVMSGIVYSYTVDEKGMWLVSFAAFILFMVSMGITGLALWAQLTELA